MLQKTRRKLLEIYESTLCQFLLRLTLGVLIVLLSAPVLAYGTMIYKQNLNSDALAFWQNIGAGVAFLGFSIMFGSISWVDQQQQQKQRDETIIAIKAQNDQILQQLSAMIAAQAEKAQTPAPNPPQPDQGLIESYVPISNI